MAWSTRQLADLAGVTLRAIRHWHDLGLLPEPMRLSNGYKQYTARHLALALRIARLSGLGFGLDDVARMLGSEQHGRDALQDLRDVIGTRIADLERIRGEIDVLLAHGAAPDLSPSAMRALDALGDDPASRNIAIVLTHLMPADDAEALVDALRRAPAELVELNAEIRDLPADADEHRILALAERVTDAARAFLEVQGRAFAALPQLSSDRHGVDPLAELTAEGMNPAQRRVMEHIQERLSG